MADVVGDTMSQLVSRILLAVLMLPAASLIDLITYLASDRTFGYSARPWPHMMSALSVWCFVAIYWFWLWRGGVQWSSTRITWRLPATRCSAWH